ncbi:MAG: membrane dipeptidase, partial [Oscillospiraceae bacterium]|nr:membrane dipeptidase [Oscillospiraceae bacterium]
MKLFDGHCDTLLALRFSRLPAGALYRNSLHVDLERGLSLGGYAQFFAIFGTPEFVRVGDIFDLFYGRFLEEL